MCRGLSPEGSCWKAAARRRQRGLCVPLQEERVSRDLFFFFSWKTGQGLPGAEGSEGLSSAALAAELVEEHWRHFYPQSARGLCQQPQS